MSEEKNGFMKVKAEDMMEIDAVAEAWTRAVPMETVFEIAKRLHFHFTCHIFMNDKAEFEAMKKAYQVDELDINRYPHRINPLTESILDKLDDIIGFQTMTDEEMESMEDDSPLPDAEFFKGLGLS